jgi:hypothetical protein
VEARNHATAYVDDDNVLRSLSDPDLKTESEVRTAAEIATEER